VRDDREVPDEPRVKHHIQVQHSVGRSLDAENSISRVDEWNHECITAAGSQSHDRDERNGIGCMGRIGDRRVGRRQGCAIHNPLHHQGIETRPPPALQTKGYARSRLHDYIVGVPGREGRLRIPGRTTWFAGPSNLLFCDRTDSIEHEPTRRGYSRMRSSPPGLSAVFFSRKFRHGFNTDSTRIRCRLVKSWPR